MSIPTRKVVYILGAGFSYGTNHEVPWGQSLLRMPLQNDLLEKIFQFQYRKIADIDELARVIRKYFNPTGYRSKRRSGASRHEDLKDLSVEEIVTFFEEMVRDSKDEKEARQFRNAETHLRKLTLELITFLSVHGDPNRNQILKSFRNLILDTDTIISFNWDTLLDRVLSNNTLRKWHPAWGYGPTIRQLFKYSGHQKQKIPGKHSTLLKLHGSINWLACGKSRIIRASFSPKEKVGDVVMMPPKMLKQEIWGVEPTEKKSDPLRGNWAVHSDRLYPKLWQEAERNLSKAKRIVFIGYSFPAADTSVFGLLRRSLANAKIAFDEYPDIHIVDPNAANLAKRFQQSFKIEVPIQNQFLSLGGYVLSRDRK